MKISLKKDENRRILWNDFVESHDKHLSVISGRRIGKTEAIINRTLKRKNDTVIVVSNPYVVRHFTMEFLKKATENGLRAVEGPSLGYHREIKIDNQTIYLVTPQYQEEVYTSLEVDWVLKDPELFEDETLNIFKELNGKYLSLAMVGSLQTLESTFVKRYYGFSKYTGFASIITTKDAIDLNVIDEDTIEELKVGIPEEAFKLDTLYDMEDIEKEIINVF